MFCSLCEKIVEIRKKQGKNFTRDLCDDCYNKYLQKNNSGKRQKKKLIIV
ncbi:MAG: hypothetical protein ACOC4G_05785 [Bacillota bacterium]